MAFDPFVGRRVPIESRKLHDLLQTGGKQLTQMQVPWRVQVAQAEAAKKAAEKSEEPKAEEKKMKVKKKKKKG